MLRSLIAFALLACAAASEAQTPTAPAVPVLDLTVRISAWDPGLDIDGQLTVPAGARIVDSVELQIDRRVSDLEISAATAGQFAQVTVARRGNSAVITLPAPVAAGSRVTLRFRYRLGANSVRSFYIARDGVLLSGESFRWYPLPSGSRRATGQLSFLLPEGLTVAATGRRIGPREAGGAVRFEVTNPTTFSFAAGRHEVYTSPVVFPIVRGEGEPVVALHLLTPRPGATERLAFIRRILDVLVDEFGPYPHPDLEVVEMPAAAMGGTENGTSLEGFVVVGSDIIERASLLTLAHEISHQWWADSVLPVGPSAVLLGEAMVNYGALRAFEGIYGERAAASARWRGLPGDSLFAGGRGHLSLARAGLDAALTSSAVDGLVSGNKGMLVHDLLSRTIGRARFKTVLRNFVRDHAFQDTTWQAFADAVRAAEPGIGWFFEQWYERAGVPTWTVEWSQVGGDVRGTITQSPPFFRADVEVLVRGTQASERHVVRIDGPRSEFVVRAAFPVSALQVDPDYRVPHDSPDLAADVDALRPFGQAAKAARQGSDFNVAAIDALRNAPRSAGRDFLLAAMLGGVALERGDRDGARTQIDAALASPAPIPELLPGLYYQQAVLARQRGDRDALQRSARAAIDWDARLFAPTGWALPARELLGLSPSGPGAIHVEVRDTSVDALPDVRIPVSPDLVLAAVDVGTADVAFSFRFRPDSFDPATTRVVIDLDIDQNAATGTGGVEYQVFVVPATGRADVVQAINPSVTAPRLTEVLDGTVLVGCVADGCDVTVPRRLLGNDDGRFDFRVRVFADPLATTVLDVLPDVGFVRLQ